MDLTKIDELDARQKALDEERAQARKAVLKEIQYLINRIDAKPEELTRILHEPQKKPTCEQVGFSCKRLCDSQKEWSSLL